MELHGKNLIGGKPSGQGQSTFTALNPGSGEVLAPNVHEATEGEVDEALRLAEAACQQFGGVPSERIADFLDRIGAEINDLGDALIRRAQEETALPEGRLTGERARTVNQLKMFADLVREGSWVEACIDRALPERKPMPKPELRRMLIPIGPVVVFGASNFPLAFSVAGGDTASALAARNPVVVKAHPAHPGTSEMVARAIDAAVEATQMPSGIFSMVHGTGPQVGMRLVRHRATKAVGFTGSLKAGRAIFDAAAARPEPIPVYAEMGSINPVFVLPRAMKERGTAIAEALVQSVTLGVGQFCTNPGLVVGMQDEPLAAFLEKTGQLASAAPPGTMLYPAICTRFQAGVKQALDTPGVRLVAQAAGAAKPGQAAAFVLTTDSASFLKHEALNEEIFGPATIVVGCPSPAQLEAVARQLPGQLTATIHGTAEDLEEHQNLITLLQQKVGRLIFNGFPTGVEVCASMHHGGPYPATTDVHFTSVGTAAIKRFARPICFQSFPDASLPAELQNKNPRAIWRLVDNQLTKDPV